LPIGIENPVERLYAVRANMNALKGATSRSWHSACSRRWARAESAAGHAAVDPRAQCHGRDDERPGPQQPLYLAGGRSTA
jgi:hypothetical protein